MYNTVSLVLAITSVVLGAISLWLTISVKKAVARTEKQIQYRNLKMELSNQLYAITKECTSQSINLLHELLSEIHADQRLPNDNSINASKEYLEYYIQQGLPSDGNIESGTIIANYQKAYASAKTYIDNIKTENN